MSCDGAVAGTGVSCGPWIGRRRSGEKVANARKEFQRKPARWREGM